LNEFKIDFSLFNKEYLKELVNAGKWKSLGTINSILFLGLDLVFANIFLGAAKAGTLAIAKNIPTHTYSLINIVVLSFNPTFISEYAKNENSLIGNLKRSFILLTLIGSVMYGGVLVTGDLFYKLWVPLENSAELQRLTVLNILPHLISYGTMTTAYITTVVNKIKFGALVNTIVAALSCTTVIILLKTTSLGLYAIAGVSSILIIVANLILLTPYASKCIGKQWYVFFPYILRSILCLGITVAVGIAVRTIIPMDNWMMFALGVFIIAAISFSVNLFIVTNRNNRKYLYKKIIEIINKKE
jgi:O-antigen/teichoic acid export membrane protein